MVPVTALVLAADDAALTTPASAALV